MYFNYLISIVIDVIKEIIDIRELPLSLISLIIALIPKSEKDKQFILNW